MEAHCGPGWPGHKARHYLKNKQHRKRWQIGSSGRAPTLPTRQVHGKNEITDTQRIRQVQSNVDLSYARSFKHIDKLKQHYLLIETI
jgi:hypothetical protein